MSTEYHPCFESIKFLWAQGKDSADQFGVGRKPQVHHILEVLNFSMMWVTLKYLLNNNLQNCHSAKTLPYSTQNKFYKAKLSTMEMQGGSIFILD